MLVWLDPQTPRIFATHHAYPSSGGQSTGQYAVQWYVIDPRLDTFLTTGWNPAIDKQGRLVAATSDEDSFHPVIGVTPQGVAYIEYTFSSDEAWPQIRRAQLTGDYTGVYSDVPVQQGPSVAYQEPAGDSVWADYSDMQADPAQCGFWSLHTLVYNGAASAPLGLPPAVPKRDVWLFEHPINCNNAEMTDDGVIDEKDLYLYNEYHAAGDYHADMNRDFKVDFLDYAIYTDEYAKRAK